MSTVYVVEIDRYYKDGIEVTWAGTSKDEAFKAADLQVAEDWESVWVWEYTDGFLSRSWHHGGSQSSSAGRGWQEPPRCPKCNAENVHNFWNDKEKHYKDLRCGECWEVWRP